MPVPRFLKPVIALLLAATAGVVGYLAGPTEAQAEAAEPGLTAWLADPLTPPDPRTAPPADVASYFARARPADASRLAHTYPQIVGNLDGVPPPLRFTANRAGHPGAAGRQILAYDPRGDGRIVEVLGDLARADRFVVLVPGVDNDLADFDTGHGGVLQRAPSWQARRLYGEIRRIGPAAHVAVVAWLGYDPPEGVRRDALREDRASAGALALDRFLDGLVVARPQASVTVIGHSYGSTVAGLAASGMTRQVTDIVALGSPGMGVDSRSQLHTAARVWACSAPNDWIRRVPGLRLLGIGHGRLPFTPGFGATALPCGDVDGHDGYFVPGSSALPAMAAIALGAA